MRAIVLHRNGGADALAYETVPTPEPGLGEVLGPRVREVTGGLGADIALDMVGGETLKQTLDALAPGGRLVTVGAHAGERIDVDMIEFFRKHISMHGCGRSTRAMARHVLELAAAKKLMPVIHQRFPLRDAARPMR